MSSFASTHTHPHPDIVRGVIVGPWLVRERWDRGSFGVIFRVERAGHPEAGSFALKMAMQAKDAWFMREVALAAMGSVIRPSTSKESR